MSMRTPPLLAALLVSGALLTGCSLFGSDSNSESSAATEAVAADDQNIRRVSPADAEAVIKDSDDVVVLDVRTPEEFAQNHLADAENIDYYNSDFKAQLEQLDKNQTYVMYCQSGNRSAKVAEIMRAAGFTDVVEVDGGISRWQTDGLPVDRG